MSLKGCFEKGLLRRIPAEVEKVSSSLKQAEHFLGRARGVMRLEYYDLAFTSAYNSMLQAARAVLFSDGVKERSHECAAAYLRERHASAGYAALVGVFDSYRMNRHFIQYDGGICTKESAEQAIKDAEEFLRLVKKDLASRPARP